MDSGIYNNLKSKEIQQVIAAIPSFLWKVRASDQHLIYASPTIQELTGISREALIENIGIWTERIDRGEESKAALQIAATATEQQQPFQITYLFHTVHRGSRWFELTAHPVWEDNVLYYYGCTTDVTDRKQAEEALQALNAELEQKVQEQILDLKRITRHYCDLFNSIPVPLLVREAGDPKEQNFIAVSDTACNLFGYTRAELLQMTPADLAHNGYIHEQDFGQEFYRNKTTVFEYKYYTKDGKEIPVDRYLTLSEHYDQSLVIVIAKESISDHKRFEAALKASERRYRFLFNNAPDAIFVHGFGNTKTQKFIEVNDIACQYLGYTREELLQMCPADLTPVDWQKPDPKIMEQFRRNKQATFQTIHVAKDGSTIPVEIKAVLFEYDGKPTVLAFARDISDRKRAEIEQRQAEEALRASEHSYRLLFNNAPDAIFVHEFGDIKKTKFKAVNAAACQYLGYSEAELLQMSPADLSLPKHLSEIKNIDRQINERGRAVFEVEMKAKDGRIVPFEIKSILFDYEAAPAILAFGRDISDRQQAENERAQVAAALQISEQRYRLLFNSIADGVFVHEFGDPKVQKFTEVNDTACKMLQYTKEELLQMTPADLTRRVNLERVFCEGNKEALVESRQYTKDGREIPVEVHLNLFELHDKTIVLGIARDISQRKQAEEALRLSEARYRAVVNAQTDLIVRALPDTTLTFVNEAYCCFYNKRQEELIGTKFLSLLPPEEIPTFLSRWSSITKDNPTVNGESKEISSDGTIRWYQWTNTLLPNTHDQILEIQSIGRDITEQKLSNQALAASEARYRAVVEEQSDLICRFLPDSTLTFVNEAYCRFFNCTAQELIGRRFLDLIPPESALVVRENLNFISLEYPSVTMEYKHTHADGTVQWYEWIDRLLAERDGEVIELQGIGRDITKRKLAEEALKISESRYRAVVESQTDLIGRCLPDGTMTFVNQAYCQFFNKSSEEILGKPFLDFISEEKDLQLVKQRLASLSLENPIMLDEHQETRHDGAIRWLQWTSCFLVYPDSELAEIQAVGRDITERRKAEEALRLSEIRYRAVVNSQTDLICRYLHDGTLTFVNDAYCKFFNKSAEELIGINFFTLLPPESISIAQHSLAQLSTNNPIANSEQLESTSDGSLVWYQWTHSLITHEDSNLSEIQAIGRDINEQKLFAETLAASEARYRAVVEEQSDLICRFLPDSTLTFVNEAYCRFWGKNAEELIGHQFLDLIPPADREFIASILASISKEAPISTTEYKHIDANGSVRWYEWTDRLLSESSGEILELQGVGRDITERKLAEESLRQALQEKEVLLREIHHRVKNNLQVMSSLLSLQARQAQDSNIAAMFADSQTRISAIALLHEHLYQSDNISAINLKQYIESLVNNIVSSYGQAVANIILKLELEPILVNIETAMPCGLIITELISNSCKHAFPSGQLGEIQLSLYQQKEKFLLQISDNGIGLEYDLNHTLTNSLGLKLVKSLTQQLKASLETSYIQGTQYRFIFSELPYQKRF